MASLTRALFKSPFKALFNSLNALLKLCLQFQTENLSSFEIISSSFDDQLIIVSENLIPKNVKITILLSVPAALPLLRGPSPHLLPLDGPIPRIRAHRHVAHLAHLSGYCLLLTLDKVINSPAHWNVAHIVLLFSEQSKMISRVRKIPKYWYVAARDGKMCGYCAYTPSVRPPS